MKRVILSMLVGLATSTSALAEVDEIYGNVDGPVVYRDNGFLHSMPNLPLTINGDVVLTGSNFRIEGPTTIKGDIYLVNSSLTCDFMTAGESQLNLSGKIVAVGDYSSVALARCDVNDIVADGIKGISVESSSTNNIVVNGVGSFRVFHSDIERVKATNAEELLFVDSNVSNNITVEQSSFVVLDGVSYSKSINISDSQLVLFARSHPSDAANQSQFSVRFYDNQDLVSRISSAVNFFARGNFNTEVTDLNNNDTMVGITTKAVFNPGEGFCSLVNSTADQMEVRGECEDLLPQ